LGAILGVSLGLGLGVLANRANNPGYSGGNTNNG